MGVASVRENSPGAHTTTEPTTAKKPSAAAQAGFLSYADQNHKDDGSGDGSYDNNGSGDGSYDNKSSGGHNNSSQYSKGSGDDNKGSGGNFTYEQIIEAIRFLHNKHHEIYETQKQLGIAFDKGGPRIKYDADSLAKTIAHYESKGDHKTADALKTAFSNPNADIIVKWDTKNYSTVDKSILFNDAWMQKNILGGNNGGGNNASGNNGGGNKASGNNGGGNKASGNNGGGTPYSGTGYSFVTYPPKQFWTQDPDGGWRYTGSENYYRNASDASHTAFQVQYHGYEPGATYRMIVEGRAVVPNHDKNNDVWLNGDKVLASGGYRSELIREKGHHNFGNIYVTADANGTLTFNVAARSTDFVFYFPDAKFVKV